MSPQPVLLMVKIPATAPYGTVAVICVSLSMTKLAGTLFENLTVVTPFRSEPLIVTLDPGSPIVGLILLTLGQPVCLLGNLSKAATSLPDRATLKRRMRATSPAEASPSPVLS